MVFGAKKKSILTTYEIYSIQSNIVCLYSHKLQKKYQISEFYYFANIAIKLNAV